jgi:hypothetical protein
MIIYTGIYCLLRGPDSKTGRNDLTLASALIMILSLDTEKCLILLSDQLEHE